MHKKSASLLLTILMAFWSGPLFSQNKLEKALEKISERHQLMGMSVVTVCEGEVFSAVQLGLRDYERGLPVDENTAFRVASVSKVITASALMLLYEQGRFDLDEDVSRYLGFELRNPAYPTLPVTFRMLLSHTSSLREDSLYDKFLGVAYRDAGPESVKELVVPNGKYYSANRWRPEKPGTYFQYSNINYGLIGTLIESISGKRFDQFVRDSLLIPLGGSGSFSTNDLPDINQLATLYRYNRGWVPQSDHYAGVNPPLRDLTNYQPGTNAFTFGPQGGLRITARDLAKIMHFHLTGLSPEGKRLLSEATLALMHQPSWTFDGSNGDDYHGLFQSWGLGVQLTSKAPSRDAVWPDRPLVGHLGEAYGLLSGFFFDPVSQNGFIFITNGSGAPFAPGKKLACYEVEEEVFQAIYRYGYKGCKSKK